MFVSLKPRGALTFCLDTKSKQKNQDSRKASLPHGPLPCIRQKHGLVIFCPAKARSTPCFCKILKALPFAPPHIFCLILPRLIYCREIYKKKRWPVRKAGHALDLSGEAFFCPPAGGLVTFVSKGKGTKPPRQLSGPNID